jgi:hypothetical protein
MKRKYIRVAPLKGARFEKPLILIDGCQYVDTTSIELKHFDYSNDPLYPLVTKNGVRISLLHFNMIKAKNFI